MLNKSMHSLNCKNVIQDYFFLVGKAIKVTETNSAAQLSLILTDYEPVDCLKCRTTH